MSRKSKALNYIDVIDVKVCPWSEFGTEICCNHPIPGFGCKYFDRHTWRNGRLVAVCRHPPDVDAVQLDIDFG